MPKLQRHGSRHPSGDDGYEYHAAVKKLLKVKNKISKHSSLAFIKDYKYIMKHDDLVELGAKTCVCTAQLSLLARYAQWNLHADLVNSVLSTLSDTLRL